MRNINIYASHYKQHNFAYSMYNTGPDQYDVDISIFLLKMEVFWVVAPCSLEESYRRFEGACCLYHQDDSSPWWWRQQEPLKRRWTSTRLHDTTTQKTAIFIIAAVRTWSLSYPCWAAAPASTEQRSSWETYCLSLLTNSALFMEDESSLPRSRARN
jgi:hypothetical protein